jgi:hypothetical protein
MLLVAMNDLRAALIECLHTYGAECDWVVDESEHGLSVSVLYLQPQPGPREPISRHAAEST